MLAHVRFSLDADASPGLLPRVLQPFARRDLIPDGLHAQRDGETLHIEIAVSAMPGETISLVEGNLRQIIGVRRITSTWTEVRRAAA